MKHIWDAIIARIVYWLSPKQEEVLKPGICQCEHYRSSHEKGKGKCHTEYPPDKEWPNGASCACQIFILDNDDDDGDEEPETPSPEELEKMFS